MQSWARDAGHDLTVLPSAVQTPILASHEQSPAAAGHDLTVLPSAVQTPVLASHEQSEARAGHEATVSPLLVQTLFSHLQSATDSLIAYNCWRVIAAVVERRSDKTETFMID